MRALWIVVICIAFQLPHTLLSRFDLIFLILDPQDEVYDARLARHLVGLYYKGTGGANKQRPGTTTMPTPMDLDVDDPVYHGDSAAMLRDYVAYAKVCRSFNRFHEIDPFTNLEAIIFYIYHIEANQTSHYKHINLPLSFLECSHQ